MKRYVAVCALKKQNGAIGELNSIRVSSVKEGKTMENKGKRALAVLLFLCVILVGVAKEASAATLSVTTQPKSATVIVGETASFTVVVSGTGLKYQWQAQAPGTTVWKNSSAASAKTATLKITALAAHNNYKFRCVVTDNSGKTVTSNAATLTVKPMISVQPKSTSTTVGGTATFSITTAISSGVSFQWQAKAPNADSWKNSGATGARTTSMKITAQAAHNGYQFRCVVKDCKGNEYISNAATLTIMPKITAQPKSINVAVGSAGGFSVTVTGKAPLSYQWQSKAPGSDTWKNSVAASAKTNRFSFKVQTAHNGYQFRCVITDGNGRKVTTDAATLTVKPAITTQPTSKMIAEGSKASFTVTAVGAKTLSYQWQSLAPNATTWKNSLSASAKTDIFSFTAQIGHQGYKFRCIVTDGNGNTCISNVVKLTLCDIPITEKYFKDAVFRAYVSGHFDNNKDGKLSASEIISAKEIDITRDYEDDKDPCCSLKGIEFLSQLESLKCAHNYSGDWVYDSEKNESEWVGMGLETIDLSVNEELKLLWCGWNNIEKLDLSRNLKLEELDCSQNYMGHLDVSKLKNLRSLDCRGCGLDELDLSKNLQLEYLSCGGFEAIGSTNYFETLDLSNNKNLKYFICSWGSQILSIDLSSCDNLEYVDCEYNSTFTALDLHNKTKLKKVYCGFNTIDTLNVSGCTSLEVLECSYTNISTINLEGLANLKIFWCFTENDRPKLQSLDVSTCAKLEELSCNGHELKNLNLTKNTALKVIDCRYNELTLLDVSNCMDLKYCSIDEGVRVIGAGPNVEITYDGIEILLH